MARRAATPLPPRPALLLVLLVVAAHPGAVAGMRAPTLLQVQVVSAAGEGAAGEEAILELGSQLRAAYLAAWPRGLPELVTYSATRARLTSAGDDAALAAGASLAAGLWPGGRVVPVHTERDSGIAATLSASPGTACPAWQADADAALASAAFQAAEAAHLGLLAQAAQRCPAEAVVDREAGEGGGPPYVPLARLPALVMSAGCAGARRNDTATKDLTALAAWVGARLYDKAIVRGRLGGRLWREMLAATAAAAPLAPPRHDGAGVVAPGGASLAAAPRQLLAYSGHPPALLSLMAALDLPAANATLLPAPGAALILELWQHSAGGPYVALRYAAASLADAATLPLGPACETAAAQGGLPPGSCPLHVFHTQMGGQLGQPQSLAQWCSACGNTAAPPCRPLTGAASDNGSPPARGAQGPLAIAALLGLAAGVAAGAAAGATVARVIPRLWRRGAAASGEDAELLDTSLELSTTI